MNGVDDRDLCELTNDDVVERLEAIERASRGLEPSARG
jgi:hypothetical protein